MDAIYQATVSQILQQINVDKTHSICLIFQSAMVAPVKFMHYQYIVYKEALIFIIYCPQRYIYIVQTEETLDYW
jgi:hypothetical protein